MVSIKNIAAKCGVSIATVSKALNNHSDVSETTRKLVCETAAEMGYFPNAQARALKTNRTYSIGVLFVDKARSGFEHAYFSSVLESFRVEAEKNGYDIMFINSKIGNRDMSYLEHCRYRGFDGVVVTCADFSDESVRELFESDIPLAAVDYVSENKLSVSSDNALGIRETVEYIHSQGHSEIAFISGEASQVTTLRRESFFSTMKELGLDVRPEYVKQGRYHDIAVNETVVSELLDMDTPPTCIILPDDFSAFAAFIAAEKRGLKIPEDISITGYDGIYVNRMFPLHLTTVIQDSREIGRSVADLLIKSIRNDEIPEKNIIVRGRFYSGNTVRKL